MSGHRPYDEPASGRPQGPFDLELVRPEVFQRFEYLPYLGPQVDRHLCHAKGLLPGASHREKILDEVDEISRFVADQIKNVLLVAGVECALLEQLDEPENARQRRPQLVADGGDKPVLVATELATSSGGAEKRCSRAKSSTTTTVSAARVNPACESLPRGTVAYPTCTSSCRPEPATMTSGPLPPG